MRQFSMMSASSAAMMAGSALARATGDDGGGGMTPGNGGNITSIDTSLVGALAGGSRRIVTN